MHIGPLRYASIAVLSYTSAVWGMATGQALRALTHSHTLSLSLFRPGATVPMIHIRRNTGYLPLYQYS